MERWNLKNWLWVLLCSAGIFATVPLARDLQIFVYNTAGKELFTYIVVSIVVIGLAVLLYSFIFRLKVKKVSQYIWLILCAGLYLYFTLKLKTYPEEAVHFLEYGLLSYFFFRTLSQKIRDITVYITAALFVLLVGILDESFQWVIPQRFWDYKDIGLNFLAGGILLLGIWKGIEPEAICKPVRKKSVTILTGILMINIAMIGLCLSNTPASVNRYAGTIGFLSWLQNEEPMTEYGYRYKDSEIGILYSRFTLEELRRIDLINGELFGKILPENSDNELKFKDFIKVYNQQTNPFLYELAVHLSRRDSKFKDISEEDSLYSKPELANTSFRENLIAEKYFSNTLRHSELAWPDQTVKELKEAASSWKEDYISNAGKIITSFSLSAAWTAIVAALVLIWIAGWFWKRRLDA
ncbi:MAG: VanZ family protein [Nitrospirae bacterium]|nr:VanZ family protein [Nitrospirota bacterium]